MFGPTRGLFGMSTSMRSAPFSRAVVRAMRSLYPEELAEKSWDNTGLLLEAPFDPLRRQMNSVLLTIDLTKAVADEAIERKDSVVIAYHPIIFRGLKALTMANSQQQSLLRLAAEGISVYCPHTALDVAPGGINDWLADLATGTLSKELDSSEPQSPIKESDEKTSGNLKRPSYRLTHHPSQASIHEQKLKLNSVEHTRVPINPSTLEAHPNAGSGRIIRFKEPQPLSELIDRIGKGIGNPKGFPIAVPQGKNLDEINISSIAICAGSGGSLLNPLADVDLLFTGELQHHDALAAIERGQCVIALFHSNTERGFLHAVLKDQLTTKVKEEWNALRTEEKKIGNIPEEITEALEDEEIHIDVSEKDRDPFGLVIAKGEYL